MPESRISGYVHEDVGSPVGGNGYNNGLKEAGEAGIPGVTITLSGTDIQGQQLTRTTVSDINGSYKFTNLRAGIYEVRETQPLGYFDGRDTVGTSGRNSENDRFTAIQLPGDLAADNYNFGELRPTATERPVPVCIMSPTFKPVPLIGKQYLICSGWENCCQRNLEIKNRYSYIDGLFRMLVGREASNTEWNYYYDRLVAGTSRIQIVTELWNNRFNRHVQVNCFYVPLLGRWPSETEVAGWIYLLQYTQNETYVGSLFLSSAEYVSKHGDRDSAQVISNMIAETAGTQILGSATVAWFQSFNNYYTVASMLFNNSETMKRAITYYYQTLFKRTPNASELNAWVAEIQSGRSNLYNVAIMLLASDEMYAQALKANQYYMCSF